MASMNRVFLVGNLTRDPELRRTAAGTAVANLRLAVNQTYTGKDGVKKESVSFFTVVAWERQAEVCQEYLKKGNPVLVEGRLQSKTWTTKEGQNRNSVEVIASRVNFLNRKDDAKEIAATYEEEVPEGINGNGDEPEPAEAATVGSDSIPF